IRDRGRGFDSHRLHFFGRCASRSGRLRLAGRQRRWANMTPMANRLKNPAEWQPDIDRSVTEYDEWYLAESPRMFAEARGRAVVEVEEAMLATDDFRVFDADALIA